MRIFESGYSDHFDGPGTRLIFYLKGCNFRCDWCGAPESIAPGPEILRYPERTLTVGREITPEEILAKALSANDFISGVTFGGGEPTLQAADLLEALRLLRAANIHTALESNAATAAYPEAAVAVDWLYSDLKTLNPERFAARICPDVARLGTVRKNLQFAAANQPVFVLRIPVVAGLNDDAPEQRALLDFCLELQALRPRQQLRVELLRQHHLAEPKYRALGRVSPGADAEPPPRENLERFAAQMMERKISATLFG